MVTASATDLIGRLTRYLNKEIFKFIQNYEEDLKEAFYIYSKITLLHTDRVDIVYLFHTMQNMDKICVYI